MKRIVCLILVLFSTFAFSAKKSRFEQLELFNKVLFLVESQYYREVDPEVLIQGAIKGMMETLDPHSSFLDKDIFKKMQEETSGEFGGLGIEVSQKDGILYVVTPIDDTPAFKAGIKPRDKIVEIDNESTVGMTLEQAVKKMRGKPNSVIQIGIVRDGVDGIKHYSIGRKIIKVRPVKSELIQEEFAFLRLSQFQKNSAVSIRKALKKLNSLAAKNGGIKGIILDLRSNPGGLLDEAVEVSSIFLDQGVVVSTEGRDPKNKEVRYVTKIGDKYLKMPLAILINGASASASEIVAGALQDHNRGIVMGSRSFGKGSVQTVAKIDEENGLKLTIAQYMTPSGKKIQAIGIKPEVELDEVDAAWVEKHKSEDDPYIREADLKNHLVSVIETAEEKKNRLEKEKNEKIGRAKRLEQLKNERKTQNEGKKEDIFKKYNPKSDYQVLMAINLLKSFEVYQKFSSQKASK